MSEFSEAHKAIADIEEKLLSFEKKKEVKCDWEDPEDVAFYKSRARQDRRVAILDKYALDRLCPNCFKHLPINRQWVVRSTGVICISCFKVRDSFNPNKPVFVNPQVRFDIDGLSLLKTREYIGLSRRRFAYLCGWGYSYQATLESGHLVTVCEESARTMLKVLHDHIDAM